MATWLLGPTRWTGLGREDGNREWKVTYKIGSDVGDGPARVLQTPGLPLPGSTYLVGNDLDVWATCRLNFEINELAPTGEAPRVWELTRLFSTVNTNRCQDAKVEDPLLEPAKISGGYERYTEEATVDRHGFPIKTSSHEQIRGAQNEWDANRLTIRIEQNVPTFLQAVSLPASMKDTLNAFPLWGAAAKTIKLTPGPWEKRYWGQCSAYYNRVLDFEVRPEGWSRSFLDEGTKALSGHRDPLTGAWVLDPVDFRSPDPANPHHFVTYRGADDQPQRVILDGHGKPYDPGSHPLTPVAPGASCAAATTVAKGVNYGPVTSTNGWYKVVTDEAVRVAVTVPPATQLSAVGIDFRADDCSSALVPDDSAYGYGTGKVERTGRRAGSAAVRFLINYSGPLTYQFRIVAMDPGSSPGSIRTEKYGVSNFLLLGIPTVL